MDKKLIANWLDASVVQLQAHGPHVGRRQNS